MRKKQLKGRAVLLQYNSTPPPLPHFPRIPLFHPLLQKRPTKLPLPSTVTLPLLRHHRRRLRPSRPRLPMRHRQSLHPKPRRNLPPLRLQPNRSGCCSISRKCALRGVFCYCSRRSGNDWYCFDWGRVDDSDEYGSTYYDCDD